MALSPACTREKHEHCHSACTCLCHTQEASMPRKNPRLPYMLDQAARHRSEVIAILVSEGYGQGTAEMEVDSYIDGTNSTPSARSAIEKAVVRLTKRGNPSLSGPYFWVRLTAKEMEAFKKSWPSSGLPAGPLALQVNRMGDLVATEPRSVFGSEKTDTEALAALLVDARKLLVKAGKIRQGDIQAGVERTGTRARVSVSTAEADKIAEATEDAYSFNAYGADRWRACCRMLAGRGYNAAEIEEIMRSKLTRWAEDAATGRKGWRSGRTSSADLERLLDSPDMGNVLKEILAVAAGRSGNPSEPWPVCADCGKKYRPPVYYSTETGTLCPSCAGPDLSPDHDNDPRRPGGRSGNPSPSSMILLRKVAQALRIGGDEFGYGEGWDTIFMKVLNWATKGNGWRGSREEAEVLLGEIHRAAQSGDERFSYKEGWEPLFEAISTEPTAVAGTALCQHCRTPMAYQRKKGVGGGGFYCPRCQRGQNPGVPFDPTSQEGFEQLRMESRLRMGLCPNCGGRAVHHDGRTNEWVCRHNCAPEGGMYRWQGRSPRSGNPDGIPTFLIPADEDQPFQCPHCSSRTEWTGPDGLQAVHTCLGCKKKMRFEADDGCDPDLVGPHTGCDDPSLDIEGPGGVTPRDRMGNPSRAGAFLAAFRRAGLKPRIECLGGNTEGIVADLPGGYSVLATDGRHGLPEGMAEIYIMGPHHSEPLSTGGPWGSKGLAHKISVMVNGWKHSWLTGKLDTLPMHYKAGGYDSSCGIANAQGTDDWSQVTCPDCRMAEGRSTNPSPEAVEARPDPRFRGSENEEVLGVFRGRAPVGYIRKLKDTETETFPWQAFHYPYGTRSGGKLLGSFYGPTGKAQATRAVASGRSENPIGPVDAPLSADGARVEVPNYLDPSGVSSAPREKVDAAIDSIDRVLRKLGGEVLRRTYQDLSNMAEVRLPASGLPGLAPGYAVVTVGAQEIQDPRGYEAFLRRLSSVDDALLHLVEIPSPFHSDVFRYVKRIFPTNEKARTHAHAYLCQALRARGKTLSTD